MIFDHNELACAVVFFSGEGEIETQMNITEFQAVLDGFVPIGHLSNTTSRVCYVEFDAQFLIKKLVFFLLPINADGSVDRTWHMPLADLANSGSKSKDLGGGPINLTCLSQCSAPYFKSKLWDPDLSPSSSHFLALKKRIAENRLGVQFRDPEADEPTTTSNFDIAQIEQDLSTRLRKEYAQEFRDHMAQLLKEQRLRVATSKSEFDQINDHLKREYEQRIQEYQDLLADRDRAIGEQKAINAGLKETIDGQARKIEAMREYFDRKLESSHSVGRDDDVKAAIEAELSAKFESQSKELKEQLQMREVELLYRNELEVQLHDEIARLREENQKALSNTGDQLLVQLMESGISFVAYHAGPGHITVPVNEVSAYLSDSTAYAAEKCGVRVERYEAWLSHYRMPVCQNKLEEGNMCGENIDRIESPIDFRIGDSDCCESCRKLNARSHLRIAGS